VGLLRAQRVPDHPDLAAGRCRIEAGRQTTSRAALRRLSAPHRSDLSSLLRVPGRDRRDGRRGLAYAGEPMRQVSYWLYLSSLYIVRHGLATDLGHLQSLAVEEHFYLLFAPVVLFFPRRMLPAVCGLIVAASVTMHLAWRDNPNAIVLSDASSILNFGLLALGGLAGLALSTPLPRWLLASPAITASLALVLLLPAVFTMRRASLPRVTLLVHAHAADFHAADQTRAEP
jgi:peptidoglycan/LPS O-acetylase OafA/YrhL